MGYTGSIDVDHVNHQSNEVELAVHASELTINLVSSLKPQLILNKLSIEIPQGCIYGLIGPSGSGKTTLQRAIIGALKPCSGSLKVFGSTPGSKGSSIPGPLVGYMPQDIALDDELTVTEMLTFLGRLNGLPMDTIVSRCKEICVIMSIDELDKRLINFSMGQRRRLSLACSLIHSPKLLLLDEPTVGSDIVLVHEIWNYLRHLNETQGTTIIMTTHYLEEVTRCDAFGFLSNGSILYHGQPKSFMDSVGTFTFEQAIIVYSQYGKQQMVAKTCNDIIITSINTTSHTNNNESPSNQLSISWPIYHFKLVLILSSRYLRRWKVKLLIPYMVMILALIPVSHLVGLFFGAPLIGLKLAYINLSNSTSEYVANFTNYLTCHNIDLFRVPDEIIGRSFAESGSAYGYFIIPEEFSLGLETRVASASSSAESLQLAGRITLYLDSTNAIKVSTITLNMYKSLKEIIDNMLITSGYANNRFEFIKINGVIERTDEPDRLASKPIFLIRLFGFFFETYSMMIFSYWTVDEYREPMFERLLSLGITRNYLAMVSLILATSFLGTAFFIDFMLVSYISKIPINGNAVLILLIIVCCVICGLCKAILIGSIIDSYVTGLILNIFYSGWTWAYGCVAWPYESLVYFIQPLTYLVPNRIPSDAIIRIAIYGNGLEHPEVIFGYLYSISIALLHIIIVLIIDRKLIF